MEATTVYFDKIGEKNTKATLKLAKKRAEELGIKNIVIASSRGNTAVQAVKILKGLRVIIVTHVSGFMEPDVQEFTEESRKLVESNGGIVLTTGHAMAGISRAMRAKHNMYMVGEIVADTLRIFGQGVKVACEVTLMAVDAGLIRTDEDVISIGGSNKGADAALVLKPVNTHQFFELKVKEIICKPWKG